MSNKSILNQLYGTDDHIIGLMLQSMELETFVGHYKIKL